MNTGLTNNYNRIAAAVALVLLYAGSSVAQTELQEFASDSLSETDSRPQLFSISRSTVAQPLADGSVGEAVNFNIGLLFSPLERLDLRADAWRLQPDAVNLQLPAERSLNPMPRLFIDDAADGPLERPFVNVPGGPGVQSQGIDLSASYVWESPRFGQFILSTKATYIHDYRNSERLREVSLTPVSETPAPLLGAEIQSSLTLTWQIGNHTASAVTHYMDTFEDIGKINVEELDALVGNLTTLDLQYGYTLKAGKQGNATISVGLRSVLDKRTGQLLDAGPVGAEKTGRMAYGSIKYQF